MERVSACINIDRPVGVSERTVNLSNGRGELLCRTGVGKVRPLREIYIEMIGIISLCSDRSDCVYPVCGRTRYLVLQQAFGEFVFPWFIFYNCIVVWSKAERATTLTKISVNSC